MGQAGACRSSPGGTGCRWTRRCQQSRKAGPDVFLLGPGCHCAPWLSSPRTGVHPAVTLVVGVGLGHAGTCQVWWCGQWQKAGPHLGLQAVKGALVGCVLSPGRARYMEACDGSGWWLSGVQVDVVLTNPGLPESACPRPHPRVSL